MLKLIAFGIAVGAAVQAWRNFPSDGPVSPDMVMVVTIVGLICAYLGGRWHGRRYGSVSATATATATASAQQTVQILNVVPGAGAGAGAGAQRMDALPWMVGERPVLTSDQLDGLDLSEFATEEVHETEGR